MKEIKNLVNIGSGDIIGSIFSAVFWFYLATLMNPSEFGELHYLISIAGIISYCALVGSQNTITVYVAKKIPIQSTFNFISLVGVFLGFLILIFLFQRIDLGFLVLGYVISNLVIGELLGKREYKGYLKYILTQKILTPVFGLSFFFIFGPEYVIIGLAISYVAYLFRIIKSFREIKINFSLLNSRKVFIINNYMIALSGTFHGQIDKVIILPILGAVLLGNYSLALQIISMMIVVSSVIYKYLLPQEAAGQDTKNIKNGFYVDAGCYHPLHLNNTYLLHKKNWNGINIDLSEFSISLFNYLRPNDVNINSAVSNKEGDITFYYQKKLSQITTTKKNNQTTSNITQTKSTLSPCEINPKITKFHPAPCQKPNNKNVIIAPTINCMSEPMFL